MSFRFQNEQNPLSVVSSRLVARFAAGQAMSRSLDLGTFRLVGLVMPADWEGDVIGFQGSSDGATFRDLFNADGVPYVFAVGPDRMVITDHRDFPMVPRMRLISGSTTYASIRRIDTQVPQTAARDVELIVVS